MAITREDVKHVAVLARLRPTDEDIDLYTGQLQRIMGHVEKISEVDTEGVEPTTSTVPLRAVTRDDVIKDSLPQESAIKNAPIGERGAFRVPKVIE